MNRNRYLTITTAAILVALATSGAARAAPCGNGAAGFEGWKPAFAAEPRRTRRALGLNPRLDARRIRPDPVHAEEHPRLRHRQSRQPGGRLELDGEFPQRPRLESRRRLSAGAAEFRRDRGLERSLG